MTSPYSLQQLELIQQMQRQQIQQLQHQMVMGGLMNANSPVMLSAPMMIPSHMGQNLSNMKPMNMGSPPIVVLESEEDDEDDEEQRTLFVANIDDRVSEELLYEVFLQTGPIEKVRIPKDNSGRQRTFGFVTFSHRCSPPYAMHLLQGLSLFRKTLTIKFNGKNFPPPMKSPILGMRSSNDNSSLRGGSCGNFSSYMDKTPSSSRHQDRQSKHGSNQLRSHVNSSPYHRESPNHYNDKRRYHNSSSHKINNGNNGGSSSNSSRYNDNRSNSGGGKYRR